MIRGCAHEIIERAVPNRQWRRSPRMYPTRIDTGLWTCADDNPLIASRSDGCPRQRDPAPIFDYRPRAAATFCVLAPTAGNGVQASTGKK